MRSHVVLFNDCLIISTITADYKTHANCQLNGPVRKILHSQKILHNQYVNNHIEAADKLKT